MVGRDDAGGEKMSAGRLQLSLVQDRQNTRQPRQVVLPAQTGFPFEGSAKFLDGARPTLSVSSTEHPGNGVEMLR